MDILFVATELAPMVKVGGLADVVAALSKALRLLGHKVTIALPRFPAIEAGGVMVARRLTPLLLTAGGERLEVTVFDGRLGSGVELVLLDVAGLFDRPGVYGDAGGDYPDNARRFSLFSLAIVELVRQRALAGSPFDIVHVHDWPAAVVPYLLKARGPLHAAAAKTGEGASEPGRSSTVLTIHNLLPQGTFAPDVLAVLGLDIDTHFRPDRLEFYGMVNFLKAGILAADALTTVSATYAREMQTSELGERLDGVLRTRGSEIAGIVNGIDYAVWNPMTDPALIARYDAEDCANKGRCKSALAKDVGLSIDPDRPLVVSIGRVVPQKGSDLWVQAVPKVVKAGADVVLAGGGDRALMAKLEAVAAKHSEHVRYLGHVADPVVHRMLAAADIVAIPSRYEPCGLVQLYAQRYGAVPVAYKTGGLADTIVDADAALETGTGILYDKPTAAGLVGGLQRAIAASKTPRWGALRRRIMRLDLGWDRPARRYVHVYRSLLT